MIREKYLTSAIQIRRTYLKLLREIEKYENDARNVSVKLTDIISKLENLEKDAKKEKAKKDSSKDTKQYMIELLKIIDEIELEGKRIENLLDPLNKGIEKLSVEENKLYDDIKKEHFKLSDEEILNSVQDRLRRENLA